MHITMIAGLFAALWMALWRRSFGLVRWLRTPLPLRMPAQRAGAIAAMVAAIVYCLLAGMGVPAQRTLLMLSTVAIARLTDRSVPASLSLCWAAAVVALVDPWAVMSAGFWLSFGATIASGQACSRGCSAVCVVPRAFNWRSPSACCR
jgi:competence protein ComEC